ncbi:glutamyl aminopeptidase [candidate division KSB3 bacterium]|uniref:Glutamyl aminopeptidase n=1 Tax=candidate division KSB3 bacterium TaxID=2044937 RepID=A0A2G6KK40_9BACT|nr:MAG: glutamyl aminopeptidase [candidate division KSB3 bacterium]
MSRIVTKDLLAQLSNAAGSPGAEGDIRTIVRQHVEGIAACSYDKMGSIICRRHGGKTGPKILLDGHMDEVAFIVRLITKEGFIKFHNLGGWWGHTMLAQRVVIKTMNGDVPGIIGAKPVHHLGADERKKVQEIKEMFIDVGAKDRQEAMDVFGVAPGDRIIPHTEFLEMKNPRVVSGKAFDDRVGVALFVEALNALADEELPNVLYGVGTVQEEVGTRGAKTAVEMVDPDVAIILEGSPADDTPGFVREESQGQLRHGPQIRIFDPTMIPNRKLIQFVSDTAKSCEIPHQVAVRTSGGTDGRSVHVHKAGIPTIVIAPPVRYIHGHVSLLHLDDYEHTLRLLIELVRRLDETTARMFVDYAH